MQIDLPLNAPFAFAQFARHIGANAGATKTHLIVHIEQGADIELIAHAFLQSSGIVYVLLQTAWYWRRNVHLHTRFGGYGLHLPHCARE